MDHLAISMNAAHNQLSVIVTQLEHFHAVAMSVMVITDMMIRPHRRGQHKRDLVLPDRVARPISHAGLRPRVCEALKSKGRFVKMCRLLGVADIKLDVIGTVQWQKIFLGYLRCFSFSNGSFRFWSSNRRWHNDLLVLRAQRAPQTIRST